MTIRRYPSQPRGSRLAHLRPMLALESLEERALLDGNVASTPGSDSTIKWTFGDTQNNLYVLYSFSPQDANVGPIGGLDPALNMIVGARYTATVNSFPHHPLELMAGGATPFDDVVLLSQSPTDQTSLAAQWESDPGVDWVADPAARSISFTLTPALAEAMFNPALGLTPEYRCGNPFHRGFQRGPLLLSSGPAAPKDAPHDGFGDSIATADDLTPGVQDATSVAGTLQAPNGVDVFGYVAPATGMLTVSQSELPGSSLNNLVLIDDSSGQLVELGGTGNAGDAAQVQVPVVAGNTYYIQASGYRGSVGSYRLDLSFRPGAAASTLGRPIDLTAQGTASLGGAVPAAGGRDTYQLTAVAAGQMTITLAAQPGSAIDPLLLVYNAGGILVASDNDGAGNQVSRVQFPVLTGQTYQVVAGALGLSSGGYSLSVATQDGDDTLAQARTVTLSTLGTSSESGQLESAGEGDYFQLAAPSSGEIAVEVDAAPGSSIDVAAAVLDSSGNPLPLLSSTSLSGGAGVRLVFAATEGQVYEIRAGAQGTQTGSYVLSIAPAPPPGAAPASSVGLSDAGFAQLSGAIGLPGSTDLYRFVAPVSGLMAISQQAADGTNLDSFLSVYNGSQDLIATDDDGGGGRNSLVELVVTAGQTYFVRAAGHGASTGLYTLTLATDIYGHDLASPTPITLDATGSGRVAGAIGWSGDTDVFQIVSPVTGQFAIRLNAVTGSTFDGVLSAYDSGHNLVAQNDDNEPDDHDSAVLVTLTAGQTYDIRVAGYGSGIGGYLLLIGNGLGSSPAGAFPIPLGPQGTGTQAGTIDTPGEVTTFRFVAPSSGMMTAEQLSAPESSFVGILSVLDSSGNVLATQADQYVGLGPSNLADNDELSEEMAKAMIPVVAGQTYLVQVGGQGSSTGEYVIDLAINDADAAAPVAKDLTLDPSSHSAGVDGRIALPGDAERFRVTAPLTGEMVINQTAPPGTFIGALTVTQPGTSLSLSDSAAIGGEDPQDAGKGYSRIAFQVTAGETFLIEVSGVATSVGNFHIDLRDFPATSQNLSTQDLAQGIGAVQMVDAIVGANNPTVQVVPGSVSYVGATNASGLFSGGHGILDTREGGGNSFDGGVVLTNGNASNVIGPNDNNAVSEVNGRPGSPLLDQLVRGGTLDASTLTFQFIPTTNAIQLQYVFASEEYDTYVGTPFDDVFGFFVNGVDYSRVPGTGTPLAGTGDIVSVNTINSQVNSQYYIDNTFSPIGGFGHVNTQMNGLTTVLTMEAAVKAGQVNTITLTVADAVDPQIDSAVFLRAGSLQAIRERVAPTAGGQVFSQLVQTVSTLMPEVQRGSLTTAQLQFAVQQAVVNGVLKTARLVGDYLVIPIDPLDFTLTGPDGLQVSSSGGGGVSANVPNVFAVGDGQNQLLVIPNANPGEYQVSLVGAGPGASIFGASYVSPSTGEVTSVLLSGNLQGTSTTAVLDFQDPSGQLLQESIGHNDASPGLAGEGGAVPLVSTGVDSTPVAAFGVLLTQLTSFGFNTASIEALSETGPGGALGLTAANQPRLKAPAEPSDSSDDEGRGGAAPALLALLESLGTGLLQGRARLDALLGPDWEDTLGAVVDTLRPDWKGPRGLLGYALSRLPSSGPVVRLALRKMVPRPRPAAGTRPPIPRWYGFPISPGASRSRPTSQGAAIASETGPPGDQGRDASDRRDEPDPGYVSYGLIAAGIGLARLADRQALRLATHRRRGAARGEPRPIPHGEDDPCRTRCRRRPQPS